MHLTEPPHDREDQPSGPLAVLVELLGERERGLEVARDQRVGQVVGAGRGVAAASCSTSACVTFTDGWSASPIFSSSLESRCWLDPTRATSSFAASGSSWSPSSRACPTHHLGSSQGFGAEYSRVSPPAWSTALESCLAAFPRAMRTRTVSGGRSLSASSSGPSWFAFQARDVVHQQVAGGGVEAQHRERAGDLRRVALARVEDLQPARPALVLGAPADPRAPGVDLGVVVAADEVGGLEVGHGPSVRPRPGVSP